MLDPCLQEGLIDGQLGGHHGVVGGGEHCLDTGGHKGLGSHLHLSRGGTVLFNVLDALAVAECLGIGDGLGGGILAQVVQQTDGVDVGIDGSDEVHNGLGVQGIGGAGDALLPVKPGGNRVGDGRVDHGDFGIFHSGQHGGGGGGGHGNDDIYLVGHQVCTDLVQVGLVSLGVGVVIGIVEGHALLRAHLIQTALNRGHDLVQGSMIHIVDDAHLKGLACLRSGGSGTGSAGSGAGCCGRRAGGAAAGQAQCGYDSGCGGSLQEAAAGDHVHGFHSGCSFPGAGGPKINKTRSTCGTGKIKTAPSLCVHPQGQSREIRICGATLLAPLVFPPWKTAGAPQRRANTPLPCNGGFRPKLLKALPCSPGPRRPTNSAPLSARFHHSGSL